jgi:hypothetical protein
MSKFSTQNCSGNIISITVLIIVGSNIIMFRDTSVILFGFCGASVIVLYEV